MDKNNNQTEKSDCEVIYRGHGGNYQSGSTCADKGCSHFSSGGLNEQESLLSDGGRKYEDRRSGLVQETEMRKKLQNPISSQLLDIKEEIGGNSVRASNKKEMCDPSVLEDKGTEKGSAIRPLLGFQKHGKDVTDIGMTREHELTHFIVTEKDNKTRKLLKKQSVQKMVELNGNIKDNFVEHMVDLADQAEQDNWINSLPGRIYTDTKSSQYQTSDNNDCSECNVPDRENSEDCKSVEDIVSRKKNYFREKSQSSNTLICKPGKRDVVVPKVEVEKSSQVIEARPKSHHFLWTIPDPGSQKLNWHKPPLTVLVVKKIYDEAVLGPFKDLIQWLIEVRKMIVYLESNVLEDGILANDSIFIKYKSRLQTFREAKDDLTDKIDFIICLGGDGTLLHASTLFQQSCPPVMAFHQGSLGFLTPFNFDNFESQVEQVLDGNASLLLRYRLKCVICKEDSELGRVSRIKNIDSSSPCGRSQILVLNEVVVDRGSSSFICNIDVYVEGRLVTSVQGDGLIISTPTGSTAYAVAAGASMIHPNVPAIMITPICPHSLSFRPIVVPAGVELKIMLSPDARNSAMVSFDGRNRQEIRQGDSVRITTAQFPLPAICAKDQIEDWFDRLAECLHWNVRKPQRSLDSSRNTSDSNIPNNDVFHEEHGS
ncbi:NAD kinase-like isoform X1 [Mercenaria mercenaria]|uniref:NAD kinase-like isoform X1 n=1 Tax=Mercenaria mercenaria TaxID=6596 RepID=UPI001E1DB9E2|nr:NAD kinase-like isoform X1 [Mercenaria mercenaria]